MHPYNPIQGPFYPRRGEDLSNTYPAGWPRYPPAYILARALLQPIKVGIVAGRGFESPAYKKAEASRNVLLRSSAFITAEAYHFVPRAVRMPRWLRA